MKSSAEQFGELLESIARLRDPTDGCPWDRAQDHVSLRPYMLEEAYEAIAAIDSGEPEALKDELGDVLLQVVLHAQIASENGDFSISDIIAGLTAKLVRRHPHVFGDASNDLPEIMQRWNRIKSQEKAHKPQLPVLIEARKLVDDRIVRGNATLETDSASEEVVAGLQMLKAIADAWRQGFEPEIALRKAMQTISDRLDEGEEQH